MGKIRSTLDIVMERTKGLSMTQEDKGRLKAKELADQAKAWAQRYFDAKMSIREIQSEIQACGEGKDELLKALMAEFVSGLAPDQDNARIIDAFEAVWGADRAKVLDAIRDREEGLHRDMSARIDQLGAELAAQGIGGNSVIPNIAVDTAWQATLLQARKDLQEEVGRLL
ncbi:MAG: hypothetical protein QUS08_09125 [Methanothrix sp.]|nr:hypothetical protein [Methanothrix sp.]